MMYNHKHEGVLTSKGTQRPHPIDRKHSDDKVKKAHNLVLEDREKAKYLQSFKQDIKTKTKIEKPIKDDNTVACGIDQEGYVNIDLDKSNLKGLRVKFTRIEGKLKRTVGLQIENDRN